MICFHSSFLSDLISLEQKPSTQERTAATSLQPKYPKLLKPKYRNSELEELITGQEDTAELYLSYWRLEDKDMEIVAYYALQESKVSNILF